MAGGLLVTPRPGQAPAEGAAPTAASPAAPAGTAAPLSARAGKNDEAATDPASPSPESGVLGLPREMSLAELFPAEAAMGAAPADVSLQDGAISAGEPGSDGSNPDSRMPLVAGIGVMLAILLSGGGFLWWRNRDSRYWQAA